MATTTGSSGNFVLEVGKVGQSLMESFTKFITYRKVQDRRLENLYATLSLTTTTLIELGHTLNKYENDFRVKDEAYRPICETAKVNLERFLVLINEGLSPGVWKNDGELGGQAFTAEADPRLLITVSLGGRVEAKDFWSSLDDTRDSLLELKDIIKYMILKNLSQKSALNEEQTLEFKNLTNLLPHIVHSVEKAALAKKEEAEFEREMAERKAERQNRRVPVPPFDRKDTDAASDITLFVDQPRGRGGKVENGKGGRLRNRSCDSGTSYYSTSTDAYVKESPSEVYEEWLMRWNEPLKNPNSSTKFLGLKVTRFYEDPGFWGTDPEYRTQEEMKEQHRLAVGDMSPEKHKEKMQKAVQAIPKKGGVAIDQLLQGRMLVSNHSTSKAVWEVAAVRTKQKLVYSSSKKWGKDPMTTDWIVTIRGERLDTIERQQPIRRLDPFNTRANEEWARNRDRYPSPPRRIYDRERSYSPIPRGRHGREPIIIRETPRAMSPPRRGATMEAIPDDGFRPGNMVIGRIPSKEEAEKKIEEIWASMTNTVVEDVVETVE